MENKKSVLDEILSHYERDEKTTEESTEGLKESYYELHEYLVGDGDIQHLHEYYHLSSQGE